MAEWLRRGSRLERRAANSLNSHPRVTVADHGFKSHSKSLSTYASFADIVLTEFTEAKIRVEGLIKVCDLSLSHHFLIKGKIVSNKRGTVIQSKCWWNQAQADEYFMTIRWNANL